MSWRALLIGVPKGEMKRGVLEAFGVEDFGVLFVISVCVCSAAGERSGDRDKDGE